MWEKQKALEHYNQALSIFQAEKETDMVAIALLTARWLETCCGTTSSTNPDVARF
ncbi:MAG: hypothetical protein RMX68_000510 [Aulosira sp. ZfuVER01]|nr:hypothetical protein [Aulosira sp. DedVER01a]MDZ8055928.1 hypothetical protein [Aulosira sp. ZfuCHP01]